MNEGFKDHVLKPSKEMSDAFEGYSEFASFVSDFFKPKDFSLPEKEAKYYRICRSCEKKAPIHTFPSAGKNSYKYYCKECNRQHKIAEREKKAHSEGRSLGKRVTVKYKNSVEKECTCCHKIKRRTEFTKQTEAIGGEISQCKECILKKKRERTAMNKQKKNLQPSPWGVMVESLFQDTKEFAKKIEAFSEEDYQLVTDMRSQGISWSKIAAHFKVKENTLISRVKKRESEDSQEEDE